MSDYSQTSDEHMVSLFRDHARQYGPDHVTTKDCEAELLRRLAAARQPQGVTLEMVHDVVDEVARKAHFVPSHYEGLGKKMRQVFLTDTIKDALAALPWPTAPGEDE